MSTNKRRLARLYRLSSDCWPTSSRVFLSLVHLRRSFLPPVTHFYSSLLLPPPSAQPFNNFFLFFALPNVLFSLYRAAQDFIPMFSRGAFDFATVILSLALVVLADITPTVPDPGHIYNEGSTCQIGWTPDPTGLWKTMNIELMTGDNFQMIHLTSSSSFFFLVQVMIDPCPSLIQQLLPRSMVPLPLVHSATRVLRYVSL